MVKLDIFSNGIFGASLFLLSTSSVLSSCGESQLDKALSVAAEQNLRRHVEFLASDECCGRLPLSAGADLAADYIAEQMDSIGLVPFDGKNFKQEVDLFFHLIYQLASTDVWPQWSAKSEFQRQQHTNQFRVKSIH